MNSISMKTTQAVEYDSVWDDRLDNIISMIAKAQRKDGYLHTPTLMAARNGNKVRLTQETPYPWNGNISIAVEECQDKVVRIPGWVKSV